MLIPVLLMMYSDPDFRSEPNSCCGRSLSSVEKRSTIAVAASARRKWEWFFNQKSEDKNPKGCSFNLGSSTKQWENPNDTRVFHLPRRLPHSRVGAGKQQGCYESTAPRNSQEGWMVSRKAKSTTECPHSDLFPIRHMISCSSCSGSAPKTIYPSCFPPFQHICCLLAL